jgi:putative ABC transport system ATP-binding protein
MTVSQGAFVVITGPSGAGKTTLLLALSGLIRPTAGTILFRGTPVHDATSGALSEYRRRNLGFVMQNFCLIPYLTAEENVMVVPAFASLSKRDRRMRAREFLADFGLDNRALHYPAQLSAGQQQRVALARAIANEPNVILADEPTGNLDPALGTEILTLLKQDNESRGTTILIVTHSPQAVAFGSDVLRLADGRIVDSTFPTPAS